MIEVVIFDVDGTLVDTVDMHAEAWQRAFREFGKDLEFSTIRAQIGKGGDQLMPVFLNKHELDQIGEKIEKRRGEIFKAEYLSQTKAFPQVRELAERIKRDGKRIVLASSAAEEELSHFKRIANIADLLEGATSSDDAERSKPEPDIFEAALKKLGSLAANRCIVVGDTPYDAIAAGKIHLQTIGLLCGGFPEEVLREAGCIEIYRDPADLLAHYRESAIAKGNAS
ncbi:MAG: HAD family hydrolase [Acidobacteriota bacterium]|nr:HAD family hydrolase [Acidobacteriota bacterium]